ncbi:MAG: hypothetical protein HY209_07050 [Candidatus Omnitrophica bacterium]|nr:hypothetical protein [Candidatus Omnitrophota bacterium]
MNIDAKKLLRNKKVIAEINRHKWLESEIAGYDIGFEAAAESWLKNHAVAWVAYHMKNSSTTSAASASKKKKRS